MGYSRYAPPNMLSIPESDMRELLLRAKEAALDLREIGDALGFNPAGQPHLVGLVRAIQNVEKVVGKRANEMKGEAPAARPATRKDMWRSLADARAKETTSRILRRPVGV